VKFLGGRAEGGGRHATGTTPHHHLEQTAGGLSQNHLAGQHVGHQAAKGFLDVLWGSHPAIELGELEGCFQVGQFLKTHTLRPRVLHAGCGQFLVENLPHGGFVQPDSQLFSLMGPDQLVDRLVQRLRGDRQKPGPFGIRFPALAGIEAAGIAKTKELGQVEVFTDLLHIRLVHGFAKQFGDLGTAVGPGSTCERVEDVSLSESENEHEHGHHGDAGHDDLRILTDHFQGIERHVPSLDWFWPKISESYYGASTCNDLPRAPKTDPVSAWDTVSSLYMEELPLDELGVAHHRGSLSPP